MTVFPTARHLASWAGQCPGNVRSAGKQRSGTHPQRIALAERRAQGCRDGRDPHQEQLPARHLRTPALPHSGTTKRSGAVKHSMLTAIWQMLTNGELYTDLGPDFYR